MCYLNNSHSQSMVLSERMNVSHVTTKNSTLSLCVEKIGALRRMKVARTIVVAPSRFTPLDYSVCCKKEEDWKLNTLGFEGGLLVFFWSAWQMAMKRTSLHVQWNLVCTYTAWCVHSDITLSPPITNIGNRKTCTFFRTRRTERGTISDIKYLSFLPGALFCPFFRTFFWSRGQHQLSFSFDVNSPVSFQVHDAQKAISPFEKRVLTDIQHGEASFGADCSHEP